MNMNAIIRTAAGMGVFLLQTSLAYAEYWNFGYGKDANGYTILRPSADSNVIYVSNAAGSSSSCQAIPASSPLVGADVFRPVGAIQPCNNLNAAKGLLRPGKPDYLLIRRGEVWNNFFPGFFEYTLSGRSASELMVIGSYAPASDTSQGSRVRPLFKNVPSAGGSNGEDAIVIVSHSGYPVRYLALTDLEIMLDTLNGNTSAERMGLRVNSQGTGEISHVLIENLKISRFMQNVISNNTGGPRIHHLAFRKNLVLDGLMWAPTQRGGGVLGDGDYHLFEGNIFDRNGWPSVSGPIGVGAHTSSGHALYYEFSPGDVTRSHLIENIFIRNTSVKFGSLFEGPIKNNSFIQNAIGMLECCNPGQVIEDNVFTETTDYDRVLHPRGFALNISARGGLAVRRNLFAHGQGGGDPKAMTFNPGVDQLLLEQNVITNWCGTSSQWPGVGFEVTRGPNDGENRNITLRSNVFDQTCQAGTYGRALQAGGELGILNHPTFSFLNNRYYVQNPQRLHWDRSGEWDFNEWLSVEPTATYAQAPFPARNTDVATFVTHLKNTGVINIAQSYSFRQVAAIEALALELRKQSKWEYKPQLTADYFNRHMRSAFGMGASLPSLPEVRVEVIDSAAGEPTLSAGTGKFRIHRSGSTAESLSVSIARGGNAVNAVDYQSISLTQTIPVAASYIDVLVTPLADTAIEGIEHVQMSVVAGPGYTVRAGEGSGTVAIQDANSCLAEMDGKPVLTANDFMAFIAAYSQSSSRADINLSGRVGIDDFTAYQNAYANGCP